ncbi:MAG: hypothetical protein RBR52_11420 [Thiomonas sp.]|uniref:hypothetical protein n=1 Tax=Thiomonas sp. TaxID=2047785 RepID=UPI002A36CB66|nr:hypothetical protein [Thiomonas sp.]MDY0331087.1 hypothetical protein [Thiomonas sp.]
MTTFLEEIHPGGILLEELTRPMGLTIQRLCFQGMCVPAVRRLTAQGLRQND